MKKFVKNVIDVYKGWCTEASSCTVWLFLIGIPFAIALVAASIIFGVKRKET